MRRRRSIQPLLEEGVQDAGVALPLQLFHRLPDEKTEQVLLAPLVPLDLGGILRKDGHDHCLERRLIRDLREPFFLHDLRGRLAGLDQLREDLLRRRRRERALVLHPEYLGDLPGLELRRPEIERAFVQSAGDLADDDMSRAPGAVLRGGRGDPPVQLDEPWVRGDGAGALGPGVWGGAPPAEPPAAHRSAICWGGSRGTRTLPSQSRETIKGGRS